MRIFTTLAVYLLMPPPKSPPGGIPVGLSPQNRKLIGINVDFDRFTGSPLSAYIALGPDNGIPKGELIID